MPACPSRSFTGEPCARPDGHASLHANADRTWEWIDPLVDSFPNGLVIHGLSPEDAP